MAVVKWVPLFPGTWTEKCEPMFRIDLEAARLDEAKGNAAETERRTKSRFLCPVDDDGCGCDFRSLRHSFISNRAVGAFIQKWLNNSPGIRPSRCRWIVLAHWAWPVGAPEHHGSPSQRVPSNRHDGSNSDRCRFQLH